MTPKVQDVVLYLLRKYPHPKQMTDERLTQTVYLCDWVQAIRQQKQITEIPWYYASYGPFVDDIKKVVEENPHLFKSTPRKTPGLRITKNLISLTRAGKREKIDLSEDEISSMDHIIKVTQDRDQMKFLRLIYSTFPIIKSEQYSLLNLVELAEEYKQEA